MNEIFEFRICENIYDLDRQVREKVMQGFKARLMAGFCWPWSKKPNPDGTLADDVVVGDFRRPWNARLEATRLAENIPPATLWAFRSEGLEQVVASTLHRVSSSTTPT
jgi:uncharacterized protein